MGRIFCETKKIIVTLLIIFIISIALAPISRAAIIVENAKIGDRYKYTGLCLMVYRDKKCSIFKIDLLNPVTKGEEITVEERYGNVIKIGNNRYIKCTILNKMSFDKISSQIEEPTPQPEPQKISVTKVTLNKTKATMNKGKTLQLTATVTPSEATNKTVTWTSSNESVATVSTSGKVTAKGSGTATITATADGKTATCKITVEIPVTKVTLNKTEATINKGETLQLTATVTPSDATNKTVTWTSNKTSVATVSSSGEVTAKGKGTATITATADGKSATCKITVVQLVTSIDITSEDEVISKAKLEIGGTLKLNAKVSPSNASNKDVTWTSTDKNVATVSEDGKVTAKAEGTTTIKVTANDDSGKKSTCEITVMDPYKYTYGGNTYRIAVKSEKLDSVMTTIKNNKISQQYGGSGRCDEIANYHIYMLLDIKKVNGKSISKYTLNEALSIGNNGGTKVSSTNSNNLLSKLKSNIDNGKPVRLHVYSGTGSHWVTVVGYRGEGTMFSNYLIISSYLGKIITGGNNDARYILSDRDARIYN